VQPFLATLPTIKKVKRQTKCQPFAKLKELQANTQANAFAAHLILPNRTQSPPTTRPVDKTHQFSFFNDEGEANAIDEPVKDYPLVHFLKLSEL
jgi:hypothetical protein